MLEETSGTRSMLRSSQLPPARRSRFHAKDSELAPSQEVLINCSGRQSWNNAALYPTWHGRQGVGVNACRIQATASTG